MGFNVRPNAEAKVSAEREGVDIRTYKVIYKLREDIELALDAGPHLRTWRCDLRRPGATDLPHERGELLELVRDAG